MYNWHMKSYVKSFIHTFIIFVTNRLNNYLPLNTDFNLSLSDPTLYPELSRRPIFESPRLLYLTLSGYPSLETHYNACSTSVSKRALNVSVFAPSQCQVSQNPPQQRLAVELAPQIVSKPPNIM